MPSNETLTGVLLAAGAARRFGEAKQLVCLEGVPLVGDSRSSVEHLWVSGVDNVADLDRRIVHLDFLFVAVFVAAFLPLLPQESSFANLIKALAHLRQLLFVALKPLQLHELYVFERTLGRLPLLWVDDLG